MITSLYWLANILLLRSIAFVTTTWNEKTRYFKAIDLNIVGTIWHVMRANYSYSNDSCTDITGNENIPILANKCMPPLSVDTIYSQVAIYVGIFVLIWDICS